MTHFHKADENLSLKQLREICRSKDIEVQTNRPSPNGLISHRMLSEKKTEFDPFVITPHKMNYILPAITTNGINRSAYADTANLAENLEDVEAKFQLSLKVPLNSEPIFVEGDGIYAGFTLQAWWQIYASDISKPFRETNYQPELFYLTPLPWQFFAGSTGLILGIEHQSNGRVQGLSRSWNRIYSSFFFEKDNFALSLRPWIRLSEEEKAFELAPEGDDNPDIEDFMGRFELGMVYNWHQLEFSFTGRRNFSTNNGAAELGLTFPLWGKLHGYATFFNGYGESLIDYNYKQTRFGLGIALNGVL